MTKRNIAIARAATVIGGVVTLVTGVTFANLTSTATLTNNTISSATANLQVDSDGGGFATSDAGFDFAGIVPGGAGVTKSFRLKNAGDVNMGVTVYATNSAITGTLDQNKVHFAFANTTTAQNYSYTLTEMKANFNPLADINSGAIHNYDVTVSMEANAVTGGSASVASFDMVFTGTQL